jgi:hypothetical protein
MKNSKNDSPWIHQLARKREAIQLNENKETDVIIVGAGIAGVMTAYKLLKETDKRVILVDSYLAGHGATGHNAGQLTTYFERPLADIAREFGVEMTCAGQLAVESSWEELETLKADINLTTPIYTFTGYAGMTELKQVLLRLADNMIRNEGGIMLERMMIADSFQYLDDIPSVYSHLYEVTSKQTILNLLETDNQDYIAILAYKKGVTNSAKISEEVIVSMLARYPERFSLYENSPVNKVILEKSAAAVEVIFNKHEMYYEDSAPVDYTLQGSYVVLCTNGFEGFTISNQCGKDIDTRFHHEVAGRVNYMVAYLDKTHEDPVAISYFPKEKLIDADTNTVTGEQYFYLTRRPHIHEGKELGLISIGGPERILKEGEMYSRTDLCEGWAKESINTFIKNNYVKHNKDILEYDYCWHGLLGYTSSGIRLIGKEPCNPRLLYNLGCNGIGIMPSIYGAKKIAKIMNSIDQEPSIFDPRMS